MSINQLSDTTIHAEIIEDKLPDDSWSTLRSRIHPDKQFLVSNWFAPWAEHFLPGGNWHAPLRFLIAASDEEGIVGCFPFATQVRARTSFLSLGGYYQPFRSLPVADDCIDGVMDCFADALENYRHGVGLRLGPALQSDPVIQALVSRLKERGWQPQMMPVGHHYVVDLPDNFADFEVDVRQRRKRLLRAEKDLKRAGHYEIREYVSGDDENWQQVVADMAEIERQSWQYKENGDLRFFGENNTQFWYDVITSPEASRLVRIWILYIEKQPVSLCFIIESGSCRHLIGTNYAESVRKYMTGAVLFKYMFQNAIEDKIDKFDLGLGDSGYKTLWGGKPERELVDWVVFRPGIRGWVLRQLLSFRQRLKKSSS